METASQALNQAASIVSSVLESITGSSAGTEEGGDAPQQQRGDLRNAIDDAEGQRLRHTCAFFDQDGSG